jgi:glycosyltransferase involved in cell wall biosynthesis
MAQRPLRILFLTFYYRPDLCAGSFRATPLANELARIVPDGSSIDVITTQPNRYQSFDAGSEAVQHEDGISIYRIPLPRHQSGMVDQSRAFGAYAKGVLARVAQRDYDLVFATSSRLMTAALGAWVARRKRAKLYLDIRDIFVDTIGEVLPPPIAWLVKPVFSATERFAVRAADRVNLVSAGFADYFRGRYPTQRFSFYTNGVDEEFVACASDIVASPEPQTQPSVRVLYAGNLGDGQGLHSIVPALAQRLAPRVSFQIVGDGGRKRDLEAELARLGVSNVELSAPMNRSELLAAYRRADVLFVHLNNLDAFKKVLPSKVFEYAALGKPVWAGVAGFAAEFVRTEIANAAVFPPCDVEAAIRAFETLRLADTPRPGFIAKYARTNINSAMANEIIAVGAAAS